MRRIAESVRSIPAPWGLVALLVALAAPLPAAAQAILVRTVSAETGQPVQGVMLSLVKDGSGFQSGVLTDAAGRARFLALEPGTYLIRAELIGHATVSRGGIEVVDARAAQVELALEARAIEIDGLSVDGEERCRVRPEDGLRVAAVWDEARKALEGARRTSVAGVYRYRVRNETRDVDRSGRIVNQEIQRATMYTTAPYESLPAEELARGGFVQDHPDGLGRMYYAPDAAVLLSDVFLDTHCFRLIRGGRERDGLVGLAFEPIGGGDRPDIDGTLWLDPGTWALQRLDYWYVGVHEDVALDHVGGDVRFQRLPDGHWIVPRWSIRMPRLSRQADFQGRLRVVQEGLRIRGGTVVSVREAGGSDVISAGGATVEGVVLEEISSDPVSGARVRLEGTGQEVVTGADGRFRFVELPAGTYGVSFVHDALVPFGVRPEAEGVVAEEGTVASVQLRLPSRLSLVQEVCVDVLESRAERTSALIGRVLNRHTRDPLEGATVVVEWETFRLNRTAPDRTVVGVRGRNAQALSRADGTYRACEVPWDTELRVWARFGELTTPAGTVRVPARADLLIHDVLVTPPPPPAVPTSPSASSAAGASAPPRR